jgi:hypothetical protein
MAFTQHGNRSLDSVAPWRKSLSSCGHLFVEFRDETSPLVLALLFKNGVILVSLYIYCNNCGYGMIQKGSAEW